MPIVTPTLNSARIIGPKPPFKPKHVWTIRQQLKTAVCDLALFDCGFDAKLCCCDLVKLQVSGVALGGSLRQRATGIPQKTGRPAQKLLPGSRDVADSAEKARS